MKKIIILILLFLSIYTYAQESITVGLIKDVPPISYLENDSPAGIFADIISEIAKQESIDIEFVHANFSTLYNMTLSGELDLMISLIKTEEREKLFKFNRVSVLSSWSQIYTNPHNDSIDNILDLSDKKIGIMNDDQNGTFFIQLAREFGLRHKIARYNSYDDLSTAVLNNEIDAAVFFSLYAMQKLKLRPTNIIFNPADGYYVVNKDREDLYYILDTIDDYLLKWKTSSDSFYYHTLDKYFKHHEDTVFSSTLYIIIASAIGFILFQILWSHLLKKRIRNQADKLSESEKKFKTLFDTMEQGVAYQIPPHGEIILLNKAAEKILGMSIEEMKGTTVNDQVIWKIVDEDGIELKPEDVPANKSLRTGKRTSGTVGVYNKQTKDYSWVFVQATPEFKRNSNEPFRVYTTFVDITQRKRAEQEIINAMREAEENKNKLITIFENIGDGIIVFDTNKNITMINKSAEAIVHWTEEEALGKHLNEVFSKDHLILEDDTVENIFDYVLQSGKSFSIKQANFHCTGDRTLCRHDVNKDIVIEDSISRIADEKGNVLGVVIVFRDITERIASDIKNKELKSQLMQSQKMEAVGQFSGSIAHDFNNIITAIKGFTELSILEASTPNIRENLEEIKKSCDRAKDLTAKLLTFSRKQHVEMKTVNLKDAITELYFLADRITGENIQINLDLCDDCYIDADISQLEQILINLTANSRDALIEDEKNIEKTIDIKTYKKYVDDDYLLAKLDVHPGKYIVIEFQDNGSGMEEITLKKAFDPFFTTKDKGKGTGLGLSTVYGIIKQHGGGVYAYSEVGIGSTFKIYWPEVIHQKNEIIQIEEKTVVIKSNKKERILIVEDEEMIRRMIKNWLEPLNYKVEICKDAEEALEINESQSFDLLVTDIVMGKMGGIELAAIIKRSNPDIKILFMSGYSPSQIQNESNTQFISKPFSLVELSKTIRDILDN